MSIKKKKKDKDYGFGNALTLAHDLENCDKIYTPYAHLSNLNPKLEIDRRMAKGELLGTMSASGDGKSGYWIHVSSRQGRCYRPGIAFSPDWCERLHFEVKTIVAIAACLAPALRAMRANPLGAVAPL